MNAGAYRTTRRTEVSVRALPALREPRGVLVPEVVFDGEPRRLPRPLAPLAVWASPGGAADGVERYQQQAPLRLGALVDLYC